MFSFNTQPGAREFLKNWSLPSLLKMKAELPAKQIDLDKRSWWKNAKQQFWENVLYQTYVLFAKH